MSDYSELREKAVEAYQAVTLCLQKEAFIAAEAIAPIYEDALETEKEHCRLIEADAVKYAAALGRAEKEIEQLKAENNELGNWIGSQM